MPFSEPPLPLTFGNNSAALRLNQLFYQPSTDLPIPSFPILSIFAPCLPLPLSSSSSASCRISPAPRKSAWRSAGKLPNYPLYDPERKLTICPSEHLAGVKPLLVDGTLFCGGKSSIISHCLNLRPEYAACYKRGHLLYSTNFKSGFGLSAHFFL